MLKRIKNFLRKRFTKSYWASASSNKWHAARQTDAYSDFNNFANAICAKLENVEITTLIEVGTGAGTLISILSKKLNRCKKFIGLDINKEQINNNNKFYKDNQKLEFIYEDIAEYVHKNDLNNCAIVAQNTFDYFKKQDLESLFLGIYETSSNITFLISASACSSGIADSIERKEADFKVYYHNYAALLQAAGYTVLDTSTYGNNTDTIVIVGYRRDT